MIGQGRTGKFWPWKVTPDDFDRPLRKCFGIGSKDEVITGYLMWKRTERNGHTNLPGLGREVMLCGKSVAVKQEGESNEDEQETTKGNRRNNQSEERDREWLLDNREWIENGGSNRIEWKREGKKERRKRASLLSVCCIDQLRLAFFRVGPTEEQWKKKKKQQKGRAEPCICNWLQPIDRQSPYTHTSAHIQYRQSSESSLLSFFSLHFVFLNSPRHRLNRIDTIELFQGFKPSILNID